MQIPDKGHNISQDIPSSHAEHANKVPAIAAVRSPISQQLRNASGAPFHCEVPPEKVMAVMQRIVSILRSRSACVVHRFDRGNIASMMTGLTLAGKSDFGEIDAFVRSQLTARKFGSDSYETACTYDAVDRDLERNLAKFLGASNPAPYLVDDLRESWSLALLGLLPEKRASGVCTDHARERMKKEFRGRYERGICTLTFRISQEWHDADLDFALDIAATLAVLGHDHQLSDEHIKILHAHAETLRKNEPPEGNRYSRMHPWSWFAHFCANLRIIGHPISLTEDDWEGMQDTFTALGEFRYSGDHESYATLMGSLAILSTNKVETVRGSLGLWLDDKRIPKEVPHDSEKE